VPALKPFEATCVFYAATPFEAQLCVKAPVAVIGGGNSAGQAAVLLAGTAERVHLIVREESLDVHMSRYLVDRIVRTPAIEVHTRTTLTGAAGDEELRTVTVSRDGARESLPASALFVFIGAEPDSGWLAGAVGLDDHGFVRTGEAAFAQDPGNGRRPFLLETDRPAVFAVGDLRRGATRRVASAVGDGAMAVRFVHEL
jgi:thioredoxin reductase (NADPH)